MASSASRVKSRAWMFGRYAVMKTGDPLEKQTGWRNLILAISMQTQNKPEKNVAILGFRTISGGS